VESALKVLREIGAWRSVGPEILSDEIDALDAGEAARRTSEGVDAL
jgi:hypothetical protein